MRWLARDVIGSFSARGFALACGVVAALHPRIGCAQAVDYGALGQIFGEPITTSATGKPQRASDVPADMVIITADDIRRSGADNIPDILQFVTGIDVRRYSFGDAQIAVRGYNQPINARLLVLVDGREVYSQDEGYVAWNAIPVQLGEIRQIEVVRGPNTALFGFNAASGVVNIITFDPLLDNRNEATVRGGTQGYGEGEAVATQHFGSNAGVRVSLGGWTATGFSQPTTVSTPPPRYASFNMDGRWQVAPNVLLSGSGGYTDAQTERNLGIFVPTQDRLSFQRLGLAAATELGEINVDLQRAHSANDYGVAGSDSFSSYIAKAGDLFRLNASNVVRVGVEYRRESDAAAGIGGTISSGLYAANAMWNWQISPALELTAAARVDHLALHFEGDLLDLLGRSLAAYNHATLTAVSFNDGLVWHVTAEDTLRLLLSRGLQLPSLSLYGVQENLFGLTLLGSPDVAPTAVWNAEISYDRALPVLGASAQAAFFVQRNTDLLDSIGRFDVIDGKVYAIAANVGSSNEIGAEFTLRGATDGGFRWNASYRYTSVTNGLDHGLLIQAGTAPELGTPRQVVILGAGYTIGRWELDAQGRGQTKFTDFPNLAGPQPIPGYVTFNARVGFRLTNNFTLAVTSEQFNEQRLLEAGGSYIDRRFIASATLQY
jgi:iron complex outermembrane receptor protein